MTDPLGGRVESRRAHLAKLGGLIAGVGAMACFPANRRPGPLRFEPGRNVRVALHLGQSSVVIGGAGALQVSADGRDVARLRVSETISVEHNSGAVAIGNGQYEMVEFRPMGSGATVSVNGVRYRGVVVLTAGGDGLIVVNHVALEDYLQGVVPIELGDRPAEEMAALEAQAIAARTYAVVNLNRFDSQGFDLRAGVSDQAYGGLDRETTGGNRAVRNTAGVVMVYNGEPIRVFYHSTCGYATAFPNEVFVNTLETPYLVSVSDQYRGGYFCDPSPRFRWTVTWSNDQLRNVLKGTLPERLGIDAALIDGISDVSVHTTGPSGRATELRILVAGGAIPVFGHDVRAVFQRPEGGGLSSTAIQFSSEKSDGRLVSLTAAGAGSGHGVGMCQWGAIGRARAGQDFRRILTTYFPGVSFATWS